MNYNHEIKNLLAGNGSPAIARIGVTGDESDDNAMLWLEATVPFNAAAARPEPQTAVEAALGIETRCRRHNGTVVSSHPFATGRGWRKRRNGVVGKAFNRQALVDILK